MVKLPPYLKRTLVLVGQGYDNLQIEQLLGLRPQVAKKYVQQLYERLGISNRYEAWALAVQLGLVRCPCVVLTKELFKEKEKQL